MLHIAENAASFIILIHAEMTLSSSLFYFESLEKPLNG